MKDAIPLLPIQTYLFLLSIVSVVLCSTGGALASTTSATSSKAAQTYTVTVGKADHKFDPEVVQADVGDVVEFQFFPTNHSVVRAEYEFPCVPYDMTGDGKTGFFSGFHAVDRILSDPPTFLLAVNDTLPVFFYCSAPGSCIGQQMVGVINPDGSVSLDVQKQKAADRSYVLSPGEAFPDETPAASTTRVPSPTSATIASETAVGEGDRGSENSSGAVAASRGISDGAIAGIAVGIATLTGCSLLVLFYSKKRTRKQAQRGEQGPTTAPVALSATAPATPSTASPVWLEWEKDIRDRMTLSEMAA